MHMPDVTTTYLGFPLRNPLVASASPLSRRVDMARRLEDAGVAAIVMYSLFEEQIRHESYELDHYLERGSHSYAESLGYFPPVEDFILEAERYLEHLHNVKQAIGIPVIGSLNGVTPGGWIEYAHKIELAGADALELNIYNVPIDANISAADLENSYVELVREVRASVKLPLALKLSPFFTSLPNIAKRFVEAGANGLVLFNRFYQPDFDLEELEVIPNLELSTSRDLRLPLRWIAMLYGQIEADFALTSGVHTAQDVLKAMMAGANVAMMASTLLHNGVGRIMHILNDLQEWMELHEYESITQMRGSMSLRAVADPAAFERANYMKALNEFDAYVR
jgi:dihydroorotate dehydrogenase (fumarate)